MAPSEHREPHDDGMTGDEPSRLARAELQRVSEHATRVEGATIAGEHPEEEVVEPHQRGNDEYRDCKRDPEQHYTPRAPDSPVESSPPPRGCRRRLLRELGHCQRQTRDPSPAPT